MSREAKELHQIRRDLLQNRANADAIIHAIRSDIPNVRLPYIAQRPQYRFMRGVIRMYLNNQIKDADTIIDLNRTLELVASDAHINEYDKDLNGLSAVDLIDRFKNVAISNLEKDKIRSRSRNLVRNNEYKIVRISDYNEAKEYAKFVSWCITYNDQMFPRYTQNNLGLFYFILHDGFECEQKTTCGNKNDNYAKSMIAVSIRCDGSCNTITCRYNHDNSCNDHIYTVEEVEDLIGMSFYDAFPPRDIRELRKLGYSDKLGTIYKGPAKDGTYIEGIVVGVDEDDNPKIIMAMDYVKNPKTGEYRMTWEEAMKYGNVGPWKIPSLEEANRIMKFKDLINAKIDSYNEKGLD